MTDNRIRLKFVADAEFLLAALESGAVPSSVLIKARPFVGTLSSAVKAAKLDTASADDVRTLQLAILDVVAAMRG